VLEITLNNGLDKHTHKKIGLETGDAASFKTFEELLNAFNRQLLHFINIKIKGNNIIETLFIDNMPVPFLSLLIDDCIANGRITIQAERNITQATYRAWDSEVLPTISPRFDIRFSRKKPLAFLNCSKLCMQISMVMKN